MILSFARMLVLLVASALAAAPAAARDTDTERFVREMLRGVGAVETACPQAVLQPVRERRMNVVCASFDGSFERFASRWNIELFRTTGLDHGGEPGARPLVEAQTEWEATGATRDRIYRVGRTALGVRFTMGQLLMVW